MVKGVRLFWEHFFNPLHLYCRLLDLGLSEGVSRWICTFYERLLMVKGRRF